ncbi:MAG: hypothetical protein KF745_11805 [Phycisphaeraceae bacterium]|nr:hypothetical protein [Phycisphaeraceae bacterium]
MPWGEVLTLIAARDADPLVRTSLASELCRLAPEADLRRLVDLAAEWASAEVAEDGNRGDLAVCLEVALYRLADCPRLQAPSVSDASWKLLCKVSVSSWLSIDALPGVAERLCSWPVDAGARSRAAMAFVRRHGGHRDLIGWCIADALQAPELGALRSEVSAAANIVDLREFPIGQVQALAQRGDAGSLAAIEIGLARAENAGSKDLAWRLHEAASLIRAQQGSETLLNWALEDGDRPPAYRAWALGRAVELGVSKELARQSILSYAARVEARTQRELSNARPSMRGTAIRDALTEQLWPLKQMGMEKGVLVEGDLAMVVPKPRRE